MSEFLQDEQGARSSARLALWVTLLPTIGLIVADATVAAVDVPQAAYALLGGLLTGLIAWAGGARIAQYVGPRIGSVAFGIGQAVRDKVAQARRDPKEGVEPTP